MNRRRESDFSSDSELQRLAEDVHGLLSRPAPLSEDGTHRRLTRRWSEGSVAEVMLGGKGNPQTASMPLEGRNEDDPPATDWGNLIV